MSNLVKPDLLYCIDKYIQWAKFDWCAYIVNENTHRIQYIDNEENKKVSQSYVIRHILENGMLDECFEDWELLLFSITAPPRFQKEIKYYMEMNENE